MNIWNYNKNVGIDLNKELGNTNTHHSISDVIINEFVDFKQINNDFRFLEPAVGSGSFYFSILDRLLEEGYELNHIVENMIYAYDIDINAINVLKSKLVNVYNYKSNNEKIYNTDFLTTKININFDYIITNPPYISSKNINVKNMTKDDYIKSIKNINNLEFDNKSDIYMMFYLKTLNMLTQNGKQIFLCSDSWIDCNYGDNLKKKITNEYSLEYIINSQLFPFFRDDTNAVITVISKTESKTKIISLKNEISGFSLSNNNDMLEITKKELKELFQDEKILNKRNVLILHCDKYYKNKNIINKYKNSFCKVSDLIDVSTSDISQNTMEKDELLIKNDGVSLPLFWQIQARVNKKPNYKIGIKNNELSYSVDINKLNDKQKLNIKNNSTYMAGIIDRFPLLFNLAGKSYHISKYLHLESTQLNGLEMCLTMNNIFTFYNMELDLKEGTRKTLRKGEHGLTKELKKSDLKCVECVDFTKFSVDSRNKINEYGEIYKNDVIYNIEDALKNETYCKIQKIIAKELNISDTDYEYIKNELLNMYYFRMRNISKLTNRNKMQTKA